MTNQARYWPALDGIRAIAILLVLLGHTGLLPERSAAAVAGVTVFFVLSGFLITNVLLAREHRLVDFYGARAARLLPALLLTVVGVGTYWLISGRGAAWYLEQAGAALFYVENFFHDRHDGQVLAHTWSLAVEEQFYLIWPFLLPLDGARRNSPVMLIESPHPGRVSL